MGMMEELRKLYAEEVVCDSSDDFKEGYRLAQERLAEILARYEAEELTKLAVEFLKNKDEGTVEELGNGAFLITKEGELVFVIADVGFRPGEKPDKDELRAKAERVTAEYLGSHCEAMNVGIRYDYLGIRETAPGRAYVKHWINFLEEA